MSTSSICEELHHIVTGEAPSPKLVDFLSRHSSQQFQHCLAKVSESAKFALPIEFLFQVALKWSKDEHTSEETVHRCFSFAYTLLERQYSKKIDNSRLISDLSHIQHHFLLFANYLTDDDTSDLFASHCFILSMIYLLSVPSADSFLKPFFNSIKSVWRAKLDHNAQHTVLSAGNSVVYSFINKDVTEFSSSFQKFIDLHLTTTKYSSQDIQKVGILFHVILRCAAVTFEQQFATLESCISNLYGKKENAVLGPTISNVLQNFFSTLSKSFYRNQILLGVPELREFWFFRSDFVNHILQKNKYKIYAHVITGFLYYRSLAALVNPSPDQRLIRSVAAKVESICELKSKELAQVIDAVVSNDLASVQEAFTNTEIASLSSFCCYWITLANVLDLDSITKVFHRVFTPTLERLNVSESLFGVFNRISATLPDNPIASIFVNLITALSYYHSLEVIDLQNVLMSFSVILNLIEEASLEEASLPTESSFIDLSSESGTSDEFFGRSKLFWNSEICIIKALSFIDVVLCGNVFKTPTSYLSIIKFLRRFVDQITHMQSAHPHLSLIIRNILTHLGSAAFCNSQFSNSIGEPLVTLIPKMLPSLKDLNLDKFFQMINAARHNARIHIAHNTMRVLDNISEFQTSGSIKEITSPDLTSRAINAIKGHSMVTSSSSVSQKEPRTLLKGPQTLPSLTKARPSIKPHSIPSPFQLFQKLFSLPPSDFSQPAHVVQSKWKYEKKPAAASFESLQKYQEFFTPLIEVELFTQIQSNIEDGISDRILLYIPTANIKQKSYHFTIEAETALNSTLEGTEKQFLGSEDNSQQLSKHDLLMIGDINVLQQFLEDPSYCQPGDCELAVVENVARGKYSLMFRREAKSKFAHFGKRGALKLCSVVTNQREWEALRKLEMPDAIKKSLIQGIPSRFVPFDTLIPNIPLSLNETQQRCLKNVCTLQDGFYLIQGPPGTGKTRTLVELIRLLIRGQHKVLVCTPSNHSNDEILRRCGQHEVLSRVMCRVSAQELAADLRDYSLDTILDSTTSTDSKSVSLKQFKLVFSTLGSAGRDVFNTLENHFDVLLIDEVTQATEIAALVPFKLLKKQKSRIVLCGDHLQLPATVISKAQALEQSMFERILPLHQDAGRFTQLITQYRCHPDIISFPNTQFYNGSLQHAYELDPEKKRIFASLPKYRPFMCLANNGRETLGRGHSFSNPNEAEQIFNLLRKMDDDFTKKLNDFNVKEFKMSVLIVALYRGQKRLLDTKARQFRSSIFSVNVVTGDGAQGTESDIVIISPVRSSTNIGFLKDVRRVNVILTRAKHFSFVVGNTAALSESESIWSELIKYANNNSVCRSIDSLLNDSTRRVGGGSKPHKRRR
ncbi:hypothetical protein P9112_007329 [Eukaryota sp. TZLM1-RC]